MKRKLILFTALLLILLLAAVPVLAQSHNSQAGRVIFGSNLVLGESDFVDGDVVIFGGNLTMKNGSKVDGDVVVFGGTADVEGEAKGDVVIVGGAATVNGEVKGDVVAVGGTVDVGADARIDGDVATVGGVASVDESAKVGGSVVDGPDLKFGADGVSVIPENGQTVQIHPARPTFGERLLKFIGDGVQDIVIALLLAGLAVLVVIFFPTHVKTAQKTIEQMPALTFGFGIATTVAVLALSLVLIILIITICLLPFFYLLVLAAALLGLTALGKWFGEFIFARLNLNQPTPVTATLLGVGVLVLVGRMPFLDSIPWVGWVFGLLAFFIHVIVLSLALGSVVLTRFGTQPYVSGAATPSTPPIGYPELPEHAPIVPPEPETPPAPIEPEPPLEPLPPEDAPSPNDTLDALDDLIDATDVPEDEPPAPDTEE